MNTKTKDNNSNVDKSAKTTSIKKDIGKKKTRYFKCMYNDKVFGRYSGIKPKQAANKALTTIIKDNGGNEKCIDKVFNFKMVECTRGSKRKISAYEGKRVKLDKPLEITIKSGGNEKKIVYKFNNKLHKVKIADQKLIDEQKNKNNDVVPVKAKKLEETKETKKSNKVKKETKQNNKKISNKKNNKMTKKKNVAQKIRKNTNKNSPSKVK